MNTTTTSRALYARAGIVSATTGRVHRRATIDTLAADVEPGDIILNPSTMRAYHVTGVEFSTFGVKLMVLAANDREAWPWAMRRNNVVTVIDPAGEVALA